MGQFAMFLLVPHKPSKPVKSYSLFTGLNNIDLQEMQAVDG